MNKQIDPGELRAMAESGLCAAEISEEIGVSSYSVRRAAGRQGIAMRNGTSEPRTRMQRLRREIDDMRPLDAVEYLLDILAEVIGADDQACVWPDIHLTAMPRAVCQALYARENEIMSRAYLMEALYGGMADAPSDKIIDVFVCKARKALHGTGFLIKTIHGQGFRMQRESGTVFPWEVRR